MEYFSNHIIAAFCVCGKHFGRAVLTLGGN